MSVLIPGTGVVLALVLAYALYLWIFLRKLDPGRHTGARLVRWARALGRPVLALRSILRRETSVLVEVHPRTRTVDHRASADYPDDINLSVEEREELRRFLIERYGAEQVSRLGTFGRTP